jgi:hypothetical protein
VVSGVEGRGGEEAVRVGMTSLRTRVVYESSLKWRDWREEKEDEEGERE